MPTRQPSYRLHHERRLFCADELGGEVVALAIAALSHQHGQTAASVSPLSPSVGTVLPC